MKLKNMLMYFPTFSPDDGAGGEAAAVTPADPAPVEPTEPAAVVFTQEQVNAMLAKERSKATRKAKQAAEAAQPQPETTTDAGDDRISSLADSLQALTGLVQGMNDKQAATETAQAFSQDIAGLNLTDTDKAVLVALHKSNPEVYATKLSEHRAVDLPPAPKGPGLASPVAPSATPNAPDMTSPTSWTKDDIAVMQKEGTFLSNLKKARNALPGGGGGLFPAKTPGKGE